VPLKRASTAAGSGDRRSAVTVAETSPAYTAGRLSNGNRIVHGVEIDDAGRHIAYYVRKTAADNPFGIKSERIEAYGPRTGRRMAWLVYGCDKRLDAVRGEPLLAIVLQSLREIDRYRDSTQRKADIAARLVGYIEKAEDKPGTRPMTRGASKRVQETVTDESGTRVHNATEMLPGFWIDELQQGEKPHIVKSDGTDEKFGEFEAAIINGVMWATEMPPEIGRLSFNSNYSASQAAINEFKMYLNVARQNHAEQMTEPVYAEWLLSMALLQRIEAPGFLDAWRNVRDRELFLAWIASDWSGQIKPAVDVSKLVKGYRELIDLGLTTRRSAARELTGKKFSHVVRELKRENEALAEANKPLAPAQPGNATDDDEPIDAEPIDEEDDDETGSARVARLRALD